MKYVKTVFPLAAVVSGVLLAGAGGAQAECGELRARRLNGLTAAQVGGTVTGDLDAGGCDIGVYNPTAVTAGAEIHGAKQYGVYVDSGIVNVTGADVHNIGESPFNGMQHGVGIFYTGGATGEISGNTVSQYQKGGIVAKVSGTSVSVTDNTVTGLGAVKFIAQNGIQISGGATATR